MLHNIDMFQKVVPYTLTGIILLVAIAWGFNAWQENKGAETDGLSFFGQNSESNAKDFNPGSDTTTQDQENFQVYTHPTYGFSIRIPKELGVGSFQETEGETVLISGKSQSKDFSMQIFVRPFNEDVTITANRIKKDVPSLQMEGPTTVVLGEVKGVAFIDQERKTREVWVVYDRYLYQILSNPNNDQAVGQILKTWQWN